MFLCTRASRLFFPTVTRPHFRPTHSARSARPVNFGNAKMDALEAEIPRIRNIGIVAHIDAGKTTTTERMLFYAGALKRVGDVDSGTTTTDFMKEEMDRGITIQSAAVSLRWKEHAINLIDTPGHVDFTVEVERAMRVVDGVVALFDASTGVQAQSYTVLRQSRKFNIPVLAFLNKMDKYNADFFKSVESIKTKLHVVPLLVQLPMHREDGSFEGLIDVIEQKTYRFSGKHGEVMEVRNFMSDTRSEPEYVVRAAKDGRRQLIAQLTAMDDTLSEELIGRLDEVDGDEEAAEQLLSASHIRAAVRRLTLRQNVEVPAMPVLCGASRRDQGVQPLLDAVNAFLPSPKDRNLTGLSKSGLSVCLPSVSIAPHVSTVALAFKVSHGVGPKGVRQPLVFIRVYSGMVKPGMVLTNNTRGKSESIDRLYVMRANIPVEVPFLLAGQIGAVYMLHTATGDTLFAAPSKYMLQARQHLKEGDPVEEVFTLEGIDTPPSVISFSLEAATKHQVPLLEEALKELHHEDPSLRVTTNDFGNTVVSGMGELHLDILMSRLEHEYQLKCRLLRAVVEYRETLRTTLHAEKLLGTLNELPYVECSLELRPLLEDGERCAVEDRCTFCIHAELREAYLASQRGGLERRLSSMARVEDVRNAQEELRVIQMCFASAVDDCSRLGPLVGAPLHGVQVVLTSFRRMGASTLQERSLRPVALSLVLQLVKATQTSDLALLEPMMAVEIHLSDSTYLGNVISSLNERNAISVEVLEDGKSVLAVVSMRNIVRYTTELRKVVKGHANMFTKLDHYRVIEDKAVLSRISKNLGITT